MGVREGEEFAALEDVWAAVDLVAGRGEVHDRQVVDVHLARRPAENQAAGRVGCERSVDDHFRTTRVGVAAERGLRPAVDPHPPLHQGELAAHADHGLGAGCDARDAEVDSAERVRAELLRVEQRLA
jgi:hypothetical protein